MLGNAAKPATAQKLWVASGVAGVKQTLALMVGLVKQYKSDLNVRNLAVQLVQGCPPKDKACEARTLQHYVRDSIRYVQDIDGVETLQTPVQTLKLRAGDCDDKAMLLLSLASAIGIPGRFCAIGVNGEPFSHVMAQLKVGSGYINAETIIEGVELGWFPPDATCIMLAHVS